MIKKKYIISTLILSLLCMNRTYAVCSEQVTEELKKEFEKIEDQYKITTTFNSEDKTYSMRIEEGNRNKFSYAFAIDYPYNCKYISNTVRECDGFKNGTSIIAYMIGKTNTCIDKIKTEEIELKKYNKYYGDPLCEGIEEFVLCQQMYDREIDRTTFEKRIKSYKESKQLKEEEQQKELEKENDIGNKIETYLKENLIQVTIISIFVILIVISSIVGYKIIRKNRRLE